MATPIRLPYMDVTYLAHCGDCRGIGQVIMQLVRLTLADSRLAHMRFLATPRIRDRFLLPAGIPREHIVFVPRMPLLDRIERFHGAWSTQRCRWLLKNASVVIHPECRTALDNPVAQVVLFYDMMDLEPDAHGLKRKWTRYRYYWHRYRVAARACHKLTISEHTRLRALALLPEMSPDSVQTLHLGARLGPRQAEARRLSPDQRLEFLYVGGFDQRKNVPALLRNLRTVTGDRVFHLHIVGHMRPDTRRVLESEIASASLGNSVILHGQVDDASLAELYQQSDFLLFPSLAEGFGLPLAEAMRFGVVACAFRNTSIPEVVGDAGILAADNDFPAWGRAIESMSGDPARYRAMSEAALIRSFLFTEEAMFRRYGDYLAMLCTETGRHASPLSPLTTET